MRDRIRRADGFVSRWTSRSPRREGQSSNSATDSLLGIHSGVCSFHFLGQLGLAAKPSLYSIAHPDAAHRAVPSCNLRYIAWTPLPSTDSKNGTSIQAESLGHYSSGVPRDVGATCCRSIHLTSVRLHRLLVLISCQLGVHWHAWCACLNRVYILT